MKTHGELAKEAGMQLALFNEPTEWKERFLQFAEQRAYFLQTFRMEELRVDWLARGNPLPHKPNVWGGIAQNLVKRGIAVWHGEYVKALSEATHSHPVKLYHSCLFGVHA